MVTSADLGTEPSTSTSFLLKIGADTYFDHKAVYQFINDLRWPYADNSVEQATINHTLEYLPGPDRIHFFNELHRVMVPTGRATLYLPYWSSLNAYADPYLAWPPLSEISLQYLTSAEFRTRNKLNYPAITADFRLNWGYSYAPEWHVRSDMRRDDAIKHNIGVVTQLVCTLTKLNPA